MHLLDEPLPPGVGWWFVTGSILLFLIGVQLITGVVLTMYYVPSPEHAYDSVRYIAERLPLGRIVRGLHFFGASFIVIGAVVHMLRVVLFGSYKKPREVTWMTGVILLLLILAFALTGYLLPWDQKAYWATTVTINIARSTPFFGEQVAGVMRGGVELGALTLLRWYAAHVFLLPAALIGFVVAHVYLMRRHGISGPIKPADGPGRAFYPYHAFRDTVAMAFVFALLITFALTVKVPLDAMADPSDATYVPRPGVVFPEPLSAVEVFSWPARAGRDDRHPGPGRRRAADAAVPRSQPGAPPVEAPPGDGRLRGARCGGRHVDLARVEGLARSCGSPSQWGPMPLPEPNSSRINGARRATGSAARRARSPTSGFATIRSGCSRTSSIRRRSRPACASRRQGA